VEDKDMNIFRKTDLFDITFPKDEIDRITEENKKKVSVALDEFIEKTKEGGNQKGALQRDIREMIGSVDERIHYWETRRTQFLQLSTAILAASIVGIVAISPSVLTRSDLFVFPTLLDLPILLASIFLFFGSLWLIYLWNLQNNPSYPFTKGYEVWRWHYRHAERHPLDTNVFNYTEDIFKKQVKNFAENVTEYKIRTLKADYKELLDQDLTQLYLLITNEKFKIKFVSQLRDSLMRVLGMALLVGIISFLIFAVGLYF
jgi:hypothetical protein